MRYGSVCSGIEAASAAWEPLGWEAAWFSEIEPFASAVLKHRFPGVPNLGDFTMIGSQHGSVDLVVGGTPCQDYSVAGERAGLAGDDGQLALEFVALLGRLRPTWVVWENVPGVLSSGEGRDFGAFLGALGQLGYGFAYRVLDAQYCGVPQRRRRVFVVGRLGDWRAPAAVLLERQGVSRHPAPRRTTGAEATGALAGVSPGGGWRIGADEAAAGQRVALPDTAFAINTSSQRLDGPVETLIGFSYIDDGGDAKEGLVPTRSVGTSGDRAFSRAGNGAVAYGFSAGQSAQAGSRGYRPEQAPTLRAGASGTNMVPAVAFAENQRGELYTSDAVNSLSTGGGKPGQRRSPVLASTAVRRLTPMECERLQGFPDRWTDVPYRGKPAADGPRYRAIGNSMAVPCMRWIGERIGQVEALLSTDGYQEAAG